MVRLSDRDDFDPGWWPLRDACAAQKAVSNHIAVRTVPLQPRILCPRNRGQYAECQQQHRDGDQLRPPKESAGVNYSHALSKGQPPVPARPQSSRKNAAKRSGKAKGTISPSSIAGSSCVSSTAKPWMQSPTGSVV
jgi:hypothetical protein